MKAQNLGVAFGAAMAGYVAELSFNYIFIANLLMYVVFFIVAVTQFNVQYRGKVRIPETNQWAQKKYRKRFVALLLLCVMFAICWIAYIQWESTIASFTQQMNISLSQYSVLWTINGIMILVAQPLIYPVIRLLRGNLKKQMFVGICIFILSFFVTSFAHQFSVFVIGMIILTLGEMFVWPAVPTIANQLAPEGKQGAYQGIVNSASTVGKAFGPLIGGILVDSFNMQVMFLSMMGLLIISMFFLYIYDKHLTPSEFDI